MLQKEILFFFFDSKTGLKLYNPGIKKKKKNPLPNFAFLSDQILKLVKLVTIILAIYF